MSKRAQDVILLAEKVMGWTYVPFEAEDRKQHLFPRLVENIERDFVLAHKPGVFALWNPFSNPADALMLLDALRSKGYIATIYIDEKDFTVSIVDGSGNTFLDRSNSFAEAVCLAVVRVARA